MSFPNSPLLDLWFELLIELVRTDHTRFLISRSVAARPSKAFRTVIYKIQIDSSMTVFIMIGPEVVVPVDFECSCMRFCDEYNFLIIVVSTSAFDCREGTEVFKEEI